MKDHDASAQMIDTIRSAQARSAKLRISGGDSKTFLGLGTSGETLDSRNHSGILELDPTQHWIRARAGTALQELSATLDEHQLMLAFEPPAFSNNATVGGMVATGLAGPRRPWAGGVAEHLQGGSLIDGTGQMRHFGGEDIPSRLVAGSLGRLGVISEICLRVRQKPRQSLTLRLEISQSLALHQFHSWMRYSSPLSGSCHTGDALYLRLEGTPEAVKRARSLIGGEETSDSLWDDLREQRLSFFRDPRPLWCIHANASVPQRKLPGPVLLDWGGTQRWLKSAEPTLVIQRHAQALGGQAICFTPDGCAPGLAQLPEAEDMRALRKQLDPQGLFSR
ncbi:glycolate oxidase subunit GlcE [Aquipseudomonas ullengensis]|uniref:Glycolate oxidase subunit GlcE n=1 Tax=Aquipseudomonas ullengensis TaxID=2759166 RepID=A0A7W4LQC8_9GAMM|nr:glycolate oxidase subunit GlcE [Pseudomonas ullengensis]MBB2497381.1 glycolate oxidase subunit GlcE [Pseudomonas ullengensis]